MATSILPRSEIRKDHSIQVGYGQVPGVEVEGKLGWGLPGQKVTFCAEEAKKAALHLDQVIRQALGGSNKALI